MAERRTVSKGLKTWLELGPVAVFFVAWLLLKNRTFTVGGEDYKGFVVATAVFVPVMVAAMAVLWRLTGRLAPMQVITLVLVVVFGGLTIWFNDGDFFKMKITIIYTLFAAILGFGLMRGKSYLALVMEDVMPLKPEGWMILTRRLALFFVGLAVANEAIWRTQSESTWVYFKTFGLTLAVFAFFMSQAGVIGRYSVEDKDQA